MRLLLVAYKLRVPLKSYTPFYDAIKHNCSNWWHFFDSIFIVYTDYSANEFAQLLFPHLDRRDSLMVVRLQHEFQGWLPKDAWDWFDDKEF